MRYTSIYLIVKDFSKSLDFYEKILDMKVSVLNERFAIFNNNGLNICLMNGLFDVNYPERVKTKGEYYPEYDDTHKITEKENSKKVFINIGVHDLQKEYERIKEIDIAENLTPIRYIEVYSPYYYFTFEDPDGNPIEITGKYFDN